MCVRVFMIINEAKANLITQTRLHWIVSLDDMVLGTSCVAFASLLPTVGTNRL